MGNQSSSPSVLRSVRILIVPLGGKEGPKVKMIEAAVRAIHLESGKPPHMAPYLTREGEHALALAARPPTDGHLAWVRAHERSGINTPYDWECHVPLKPPRLRSLNATHREMQTLANLLANIIFDERQVAAVCASVSRAFASRASFNGGCAYTDWLTVLGMADISPHVSLIVETVILHHADFEQAQALWSFMEDDVVPAG